jgi:type IV pilus modification protein PilV
MQFLHRHTADLTFPIISVKGLTGRRRQANVQGFTLIEVLIAMAIFAIGVLAVTSMQMRSISLNTSARLQTEASTLAVDWMERLLVLPYDDSDGSNCLDTSYFTEGYFNDDGIAPVVGDSTIDYPNDCEEMAARFLESQGGSYTMKWMVRDAGKGLPIKEIQIRIDHAHRNAKSVRLTTLKGHDEELPES